MDLLIPKPLSVVKAPGSYTFPPVLAIAVAPGTPEVDRVARQLGELLQRRAGQ